ncbi:heme ABC exporter ATP-binding protein CcmA [Desulfolutivibrio sulfoxidireducens]|uniref:heme ABC exporter ATP-binding protein CcmA n=1 Tax=Desulfolutivibrio sulfoxidireducens TaxID=2773299 RepID=UPI00159D83B1|nr:heme ABC exporter ATP-binding protein CcmA [Desulfolutivibrio sulfoxidireducens]QLA15588.1 heme ABC exporter ATP-binding protein CcmA [Desulfolutivibrio sulfoxidireducens]
MGDGAARTAADHGPCVLLRLRKVAKRYGERVVLRGIDVEVLSGSILLVVGRNGAGKSTLLRIMAGLARPEPGEVEHLVDPGRTAFLGHRPFLYPKLSADENLAFWGRMHGRNLDRTARLELLTRVGLADFAHEPAGVFSRGMTQRLDLARVFAQSPRLFFLDEPASGLDAASAALLRREMRQARDAGAGAVMVSHDVAGDLPLADRVLHLEGTRAVFLGPVRDFDAGAFAGGRAC